MVSRVVKMVVATIPRTPKGNDEDLHLTQRKKTRHELQGLLVDDQQPLVVIQPAAGIKPFRAGGVLQFDHRHPTAELPGVDGGLAQHIAVETRAGLENPLPVDQVGVARAPDLGRPHDLLETVGVDGGPQDPGLLVLMAPHRDDEVRLLAEPHVDVTFVMPLDHDLVEPGLIEVVAPSQIIRADIRPVGPAAVDNAEIHEGAGPVVHHFENAGQILLVDHLREVMGIRHGIQNGRALLQKQIHRLRLGLGPVADLFPGHFAAGTFELVIEHTPQDQQRRQRHHQGQGNDFTLERAIQAFFHGLLLFRLARVACISRRSARAATASSRRSSRTRAPASPESSPESHI